MARWMLVSNCLPLGNLGRRSKDSYFQPGVKPAAGLSMGVFIVSYYCRFIAVFHFSFFKTNEGKIKMPMNKMAEQIPKIQIFFYPSGIR